MKCNIYIFLKVSSAEYLYSGALLEVDYQKNPTLVLLNETEFQNWHFKCLIQWTLGTIHKIQLFIFCFEEAYVCFRMYGQCFFCDWVKYCLENMVSKVHCGHKVNPGFRIWGSRMEWYSGYVLCKLLCKVLFYLLPGCLNHKSVIMNILLEIFMTY